MYNMTFDIKGIQYKRVSKPMARKAYDTGKDVVICACKLRPGKPWYPEAIINNLSKNSFNSSVNEYEWNNCNAEAGYYAAFYIEV